MSELIAEARVLVTPDTTLFRNQLATQLTALTKTIPPVPVAVTPVVTGTGNVAALAAQQSTLAAGERKIAEETAGATAARNAAAKSTAAYTRSLGGLSSGAASAGLSLVGLRGATLAATGPFLAGAAGAIALSKSVALATSFNSEIAVLGAVTGATGEQMETAAAAAREFGRDITLPGVTAGDAAKTITEFSKAGLDLNESIAATRGGLQLAQAAQVSYTDAVTLTANALNAFGLSGNQAVRVADTLANASNLAQGGIEDTALALRQAATAAEAVGVSFEDTTALLTLLAKNGLTGSDAGTALRTAFLRLVNPSKEANAILKDLNVNIRDINGNVRPEVFADFAAAQADLSVKTQQANAAIVFGQDAFRAYAVLAQEGTESLTNIQQALRQTGTAARIAQARMTGLAGAQENLSNQLSALGETIGQVATPPLTFFVNELARYAGVTGEVIAKSKQVADAFAEISEEIPGGGGGLDFGQSFRDAFQGVRDLNPQAAAIFDFIDIIREKEEEAEEVIRNGGVALRDELETAGREAARGAVSFADQITGAINSAFALVQATMAQANQSARAATFRAVGRAGGRTAGLEEQFNQILAEGGDLREQRANLERRAREQETIIREAGPQAAGDLLKARRAAQAELGSINQQIIGIDKSIAANQKAANDERQRIRDQNLRDAEEAFLFAQQDARARQERSITIAGGTAGLRDDIREQKELRALIISQIAAIKASSLAEKAKQQAIRDLRAQRDATTDEIRRLRQADQEARQAAREEFLDAQEAFAQSVFDLTGNKNPLLKVISAQLKAAIQVKNGAKKGSLEWLRAKTEINELLLQRKELLKQVEEDARSTQSFGFEFLQRQQGFAANLLGNLIPGFATAGLVGNTSTSNLAPITDPGLGFAAEVPTANQLNQANARGVRPVQVDTTNSLLRSILAALNGRHTTPPEIRHNQAYARSEMDTLGGY